ncbi:MAG: G8 domain-containing protein, partial [Chloroflexota bacterium]
MRKNHAGYLTIMMVACAGIAFYLLSQNHAAANIEDRAVSINNFSFSPDNVQAVVGETITWTNDDATTHTVTGNDFDSGDMANGADFSITFTEPGSYSYVCSIHSSMTGLINVSFTVGDSIYLPTIYGSGNDQGASSTPPTVVDIQTVRSGDWSNPLTWEGGRLPQAGEHVHISSSHTVILDTDTAGLGSLLIGGKLIFADQPIELTAGWIMVHGDSALLQIGTEAEPFQNQAVITLTGTNEDENISGESPLNSGTKFLMIMEGGQLELHGSSRDKVSWTQLNAHADAGSTSITLAETVNWEAGDQIVIAPSGFDPYEAEQVTVTAVDGNQVSFTPALQFDHWGTIQTYEGKEVDQRAEVGLLTRNIRIQGDEDSLESNFGGHTMIMPNGSARVEGVEFYRMGQMGHAA